MNRHYQIPYFITLMTISLLSINIAVAAPPTKVTVTNAYPGSALQGDAVDVVISGSGFDAGSKVKFLVTGTKDDSQISVDPTVDLNPDGTLTARIHVLGNAQVIDYDIEVRTSSGRRGKGVTLFRVRTRDGGGKTNAECIVFTGNLETVPGSEVVEDCCPNAGPFPAYTMSLDLLDADGTTYVGQYKGQLFTKFSSNGPHKESKVQFWSWDSDLDTPGVGDIFFEIDGGDVVFDRKSDFLTVSFTDEQPTLWLYDHWEADGRCCAIEAPVLPVSFELVRTSDLTYCE
jgi:hypothetical protein